MTVMNAILIIAGCLIAVVLICMAVIFVEKRNPGEAYDERQKIARGNAYRISFCTGVVYFPVVLILDMLIGMDSYALRLLIYIGLFAQAMLFHIYCFLTDAALPMYDKAERALTFYAAMTVVSYMNFQSNMERYDLTALTLTGEAAGTVNRLILCVGSAFLTLVYLIQIIRNKKESKVE